MLKEQLQDCDRRAEGQPRKRQPRSVPYTVDALLERCVLADPESVKSRPSAVASASGLPGSTKSALFSSTTSSGRPSTRDTTAAAPACMASRSETEPLPLPPTTAGRIRPHAPNMQRHPTLDQERRYNWKARNRPQNAGAHQEVPLRRPGTHENERLDPEDSQAHAIERRLPCGDRDARQQQEEVRLSAPGPLSPPAAYSPCRPRPQKGRLRCIVHLAECYAAAKLVLNDLAD